MLILFPILAASGLLAPANPLPDDDSLAAVAEKQLAAVPPPELEGEWPRWSGKLGAGSTGRAGNDSSRRFNANAELGLRRERDRWRADGYWRYADKVEADGSRKLTTRHFGGALQYDFFVDKQEYVLWNASGERDHESLLDLRVTSGLGYGYQFKQGDSLSFAAELGAGWFYEDYSSALPADRTSGRMAIDWSWKPRELWSLEQRAEFFPNLTRATDSLSRIKSQLRYDLAASWYALASWRFQWDNEPAQDDVQGDHDLAMTLGWSF